MHGSNLDAISAAPYVKNMNFLIDLIYLWDSNLQSYSKLKLDDEILFVLVWIIYRIKRLILNHSNLIKLNL